MPDIDAIRRELAITCADAVSLMTEYLEGAMTGPDHDRFARHLAGCEACAVYLDQLRRTVTIVGGVGGDAVYEVDAATLESLVELYRGQRP